MKAKRALARSMMTTVAAGLMLAITSQAAAAPLKVFILAGQSNMEGPAGIETFDYIGDDPATAPLLKMMRGADGKPTVCEGAWISYLTGIDEENFEVTGKLTAGFGSMWGLDSRKPGDKIGPEFTFGLTMDAALAEPVLIIKAAWGGKSLHTDFRSPGAGPYELSAFQREHYPRQAGHGIPKDFEQWKAEKAKATGHYYRLMIGHVRKCWPMSSGSIRTTMPPRAANSAALSGCRDSTTWSMATSIRTITGRTASISTRNCSPSSSATCARIWPLPTCHS
jgi:alpha-galactosidase